jgi:hypothetical protein
VIKIKNEEAKGRYRAVKIHPQWVVMPGKQTTNYTSEKGKRVGDVTSK